MSGGTYKALNRAMGQAIHRYAMIQDHDRIAVGLSGGKDSLSLLWMLSERLHRIHIRYRLFPIYIDPGFDGGFGRELADYCADQGHDLWWEQTDHGPLAHSDYNRENPCFLCSRLRRKRLFEIADHLGCARVALGHHKDDLIETFFMNICFAGEVSTMLPAQSLFSGKLTVIRPLAFAEADLIRRFARSRGLPNFNNPCPSARTSKRQAIKTLLRRLYRINPKVKGNIFRSMSHVKPEYLLK
jgi:tRNA 2-thiocytidine biosynthesis protein TtcA